MQFIYPIEINFNETQRKKTAYETELRCRLSQCPGPGTLENVPVLIPTKIYRPGLTLAQIPTNLAHNYAHKHNMPNEKNLYRFAFCEF